MENLRRLIAAKNSVKNEEACNARGHDLLGSASRTSTGVRPIRGNPEPPDSLGGSTWGRKNHGTKNAVLRRVTGGYVAKLHAASALVRRNTNRVETPPSLYPAPGQARVATRNKNDRRPLSICELEKYDISRYSGKSVATRKSHLKTVHFYLTRQWPKLRHRNQLAVIEKCFTPQGLRVVAASLQAEGIQSSVQYISSWKKQCVVTFGWNEKSSRISFEDA